MDRFFLFEDSLLYTIAILLFLLPTIFSLILRRKLADQSLYKRSYQGFEKGIYLLIYFLIGTTLLTIPFKLLSIEINLLLLIGLLVLLALSKFLFEVIFNREAKKYLYYLLWSVSLLLLFLTFSIFLFSSASVRDVFEKEVAYDAESIYKVSLELYKDGERKTFISRDGEVIEGILANLSEVKVKKRLFKPENKRDLFYHITFHSHQKGVYLTVNSHYFQVRPNKVYYITDAIINEDLFLLDDMTEE